MSKAAELANLIGNINAGGGGVNRNLIINGAMNVSQRGTSFADPANSTYTLDRFIARKSNDGAVTITQDSSAPSGFANSLKVDVTTADTSIGASQFSMVEHRIEAQNLQGLAFGTFFSTAEQDKKIDISKAHVISVAFINDKIEGEYKRIFSKVIEPAKPKIIT